MEIRVYNRNMDFQGIVENHTSLIWTRRYYEPGGFELHAPITAKNLQLLQPGNIITRRDKALKLDVVEAGIIGDVENEESDIKNELTRQGRFLSWYLDRRLIYGPVNFSGKVEVAMRQLLTGAEPIPLVQLGDLQGFPEMAEFQVTMKNLCTYESKLARSTALGYRLRPDFKQKAMFFDVYKGTDRTISQGINSRVIFSESYHNLNNAIYKYNDQLYRTKAIVGGEGEGTARVYVTVGDGAGFDLRELFVDAKDINSEDLTWEEYLAALRQRGIEKLAECVVAESMECETEAHINFRYKEHYDLGDIVTVRKRAWGIDMNQRITEVMEVYQYGGMMVVPTLGDALPQKVDWGE